MNRLFYFVVISFSINSCSGNSDELPIHENDWETRKAEIDPGDSLLMGSTYLAVYSSIYSYTEKTTTKLTATISLRNTNISEQIYVLSAKYYDTHGNLIRTYIDHPIYIRPMETLEIVIHQIDEKGGTGANFVFDWATTESANEPYFEAIMISTSGQQGISFSTEGIRTR